MCGWEYRRSSGCSVWSVLIAYPPMLMQPRLDGWRGRAADAMTVQINIKRVNEPPGEADGQRILVERLWPCGVRRDAIKLDRWEKELGASDTLRRWYGHAPHRWPSSSGDTVCAES